MIKSYMNVGHITGAIYAAFRKWERGGKVGPMPNWYIIVERFFKRFGRQVGRKVRVQGPFGLRCAFSVYLGRRWREFEISHSGVQWRLGRRNYKHRNNDFPKGSIGDFNQLNFAYEEIPNSTPLSELFGL